MMKFHIGFDADAAVGDVVPRVVARYRAKGILTWKLLHKVEEEVLLEIVSMGPLSERLLQLMCAPAVLDCPDDDRPVSFEGHDPVPFVFAAIDRAWRQVH